MLSRFTRITTLRRVMLVPVAAAAAVFAAAAPSMAASGPPQYTTNSAGYVVTGASFANATTTVGARSVAQYNKTANETGFGHGITLVSKQYTASLGISVYNGDSGPNPWDAGFALYNSSGAEVAGCLAGNPGGTTDTCPDSASGEPGAFAPGPVKLTLSYNPATNVLTFDATQTTATGVNDWTGTENIGADFGTPTTYFKTAEVGTTVTAPSSQPAQPQLLGKFSATSLTSYATGAKPHGLSYWTAAPQYATTGASPTGTALMSPTALSNYGHVFEVIDDQG